MGTGLASFLEKAHPNSVIPVVFGNATKSLLGRAFLGAVETGRHRDHIIPEGDAMAGEPDTHQFWHEVERCQGKVLPGPGERIHWGVRDFPARACPEDRKRACPEACLEPCPRNEGFADGEVEGTAPSPTAATTTNLGFA
jgi:hypothetical protein